MPIINRKSKKEFSRQPERLTREETNEAQFWKEVAEKSESMIANLIEKVLPISATPSVFNLEKDADYRVLLREDLPNYYAEQEEYQEKMATQSWNKEDVEYVSQDLVCAYFDLVIKAFLERLSEYPAFENTSLSQWRKDA